MKGITLSGRFELLTAVVASSLALGAIGCGDTTVTVQPSGQTEPAKPARGSARVNNATPTLTPSSEFTRDCGNGLQTNSVTTCEFGRAVYQAWALGESGVPGIYRATSPVTGQTYDMNCSGGNPVVCREVNATDGANDAAVRFLR